MVAAKRTTGSSGQTTVAKGLLILGMLFFVAQAAVTTWSVLQYGGQYWNPSGDGVSSLGLALVHAVNTLAWNPGVALASAIRVLVSCWPLLLIVTGVVLLRRSTSAGAKGR